MTRARQQSTAYAEQVQRFYRSEVDRHGYNHKGLGYRRQESQVRRFEVLADIGTLHRCRILDVGAGLGDFLAYLYRRGVVPDYTGLELCEHLVAGSEQRFSTGALGRYRFIAGDILDLSVDAPFDYVIASGIFGLHTTETRARVAPTLKRMVALSTRGVAVNFLSANATAHAERSEYLRPADLLEIAWGLTPAVTLRHDYLPNDFTLYLYRQRRWPNLARKGDPS
ncbi:MAG TPA: class I SAM-dependent methyltransferase [Kofleriaceae bacterium]|nr:class I SAM-dependent methyltransferase [Kofleriaceae bacterium]